MFIATVVGSVHVFVDFCCLFVAAVYVVVAIAMLILLALRSLP